MGGRVVHASSPQGRFAAGAAALDGRRLVRSEAYGKNLFLRFSVPRDATGPRTKPWLFVHLGLIGAWRWFDGNGKQTTGRRLRGADGSNRRVLLEAGRGADAVSVDLRGAITCAVVDDGEMQHELDKLGPDPLRDDADPDEAYATVRRSRSALGTLILRQDVVAGPGLIWRCEAPFLAGIAPQRKGRDMSEQEWSALWGHLAGIMSAAVGRGGTEVTTVPSDRPPGARRRVPRDERFYLFRRGGQPCRVCGTTIRSEPMGGRAVWWCPTCQPD